MRKYQQIFIASCFALDDQKCVAFFKQLGDALVARDVQLVLLTTQRVVNFPYAIIDIPYSLYGFNEIIHEVPGVPFHPVLPLLAAEHAWSGYWGTSELCSQAVAKCEWFYRCIADEMQPCAAMLWNTTHPHSRVARDVLQANNIPAWCIERGQLAGSYQVQTGEVNAWDDTLAVFSLHANMQSDLEHQGDAAFEAARAISAAAAMDRHGVDIGGCTSLPQDCNRSILVLSSAIGSSIEPVMQRSIGLTQPIWQNYQEAIDALDASLPEDYTILFRDHPINRIILASKPLKKPDRFIDANHGTVGTLMDSVGYVACIGTTTLQYEALLRDKPMMVFGNNLVARAGAAYACLHAATLNQVVAAWLADTDGACRRKNARNLIGLICERHLVRENDSYPHIRHDVSDLANFIAAQATTVSSSAADRITRFSSRMSG